MTKSAAQNDESPSRLIDAKIKRLSDWRGETLARIRKLIREAGAGIVEDVKWRKPSNPEGVPVWEHNGLLCTGETYKDKVKLTFAKGAALKDPKGLFNAGLEGNVRRAIDFFEGDKINAAAFRALIGEAVSQNTSEAERKAAKKSAKKAAKKAPPPRAKRTSK